MKIKNADASKLLSIYSKMVNASLEEGFFDMGYEVAVNAISLEEGLKPFHKVREGAQKKLEGLKQGDSKLNEVLEKANKEIQVALEKEIEVKEFTKISKDFIVQNKIKLTGIEILALKEFKILD